METLEDLMKQRSEALGKGRSILDAAKAASRAATDDEMQQFRGFMVEYDHLDAKIAVRLREQESERQREQIGEFRAQQSPEKRKFHTENLVKIATGQVRAVSFSLGDAYQLRVLRARGATMREAEDELIARKAEVRAALPEEKRALSVGSDGAVVPTGFLQRLIDYREQYSGFLRTQPFMITSADGAPMEIATVSTQGTAAFVAEEGTIGGVDATFGTVTLSAYKYGQLVLVSSELSEDNAVMLEEWLARDMGRGISRVQDSEFVIGTSANRTHGIAGASTPLSVGATGTTGVAGAFTIDNLIDLKYSLDEGYDTDKATWFMRRSSAGSLRKLKDTDGQYLWQPGLIAGDPDRFINAAVVTSPHMPAPGLGARSVAYGNTYDGTIVRDVGAMRLARSTDFKFDTDQIAYRVTLRTDMKVVDDQAVKLFVGGAS